MASSSNKNTNLTLRKQTHLYLQDRKIKIFPEICSIEHLTMICLHNNLLAKIEPSLNAAVNLECLYLQHNAIKIIENVSKLKRLKKLHLGYNEISVVENIEDLDHLEELYVERQRGEPLCFDPRSINGIANSLQILNVSHNNIKSSLRQLQPLELIRVFDASYNKIECMDNILDTIQYWYYLFDATFVGNPVAKKHLYRENIIGSTVRLEILDKKPINEMTRCFIRRLDYEKKNNRQQTNVNLPDVYPDLPKNFPHPLQKAVSHSLLNTSLSNHDGAKHIPWNALPVTLKKHQKQKADVRPQRNFNEYFQ